MSTKKICVGSKSGPSTPSRCGVLPDPLVGDPVLAEAEHRYPTDGEFLLDKGLHLTTPSGGKFYLSRLTPPTPQEEGVERRDRREGPRQKDREVQSRIELYRSQVERGEEIVFDPMPQWILDQQVQKSGDRMGKLAQSIGIPSERGELEE